MRLVHTLGVRFTMWLDRHSIWYVIGASVAVAVTAVALYFVVMIAWVSLTQPPTE